MYKSSRSWPYDPAVDGCAPGRVSWDYSTTSDILVIQYDEDECRHWGGTTPPATSREYYSRERALALYAALKDWAEGPTEGVASTDASEVRRKDEPR